MTPTLSQGQAEPTDADHWKALNAAHDIADEAWCGLLLIGPDGEPAFKSAADCKASGTLLPAGWQWFDCYAKGAVDVSQGRVETAFGKALAASHAAPAADLRAAPEAAWDEAQRISDLPAVDEAIRNLIEDATGDNAACLVREVLRAAQLAAVAAPPEVKDEFTEGVNAAAAMLDKMADDFAYEHSVVDWETGAREFGGRGSSSREDYYNTLRELADDIRTIIHGNEKRTVAAVAAPEARIEGQEMGLLTFSLAYMDGLLEEGPPEVQGHWKRVREAAMLPYVHPAAPGSSTPSAAPLSEPCALDQGARPAWPVSEAVRDALAERRRQQEAEGWTTQHDDEHDMGDLSAAGSAYALAAADLLHPQSQGDGGFTMQNPPTMWPPAWHFKPADPRRMLVKAAALLLAEIERLDRIAPPVDQQEGSTQ